MTIQTFQHALLFVSILFCGVGTPLVPQPEDSVEHLVEMLKDDDEPWNAIRAMGKLWHLPQPPIEVLHEALDSTDLQQRQIAASLLWRFLHPPEWRLLEEGDPEWWGRACGYVSQRLLEVTIEGLRSDSLPYDLRTRRYTHVFNAADGFRYLSQHAHEARELLEEGLKSDDIQQRFLCALALGFGGVEESASKAAPILLPHLRDNDIREDAKWAVAAFYRFGVAVLPALQEARPDADEQQGKLIDLLILDFTDPPTSIQELQRRQTYNDITKTVFDPAIESPLDDWMGWLRGLTQNDVD